MDTFLSSQVITLTAGIPRPALGVCVIFVHSPAITMINRVNWAQWGSDYAAGWQGAAGRLSQCCRSAAALPRHRAWLLSLQIPADQVRGDTRLFKRRLFLCVFGLTIVSIALSVECQIWDDGVFVCGVSCSKLRTRNQMLLKVAGSWDRPTMGIK